MTSPADVVSAFLQAASQRDYDRALPMLTDDVVYQNMMLPAVHGHDGVRDTLEGLLALCSTSEWVTHRQVADGDLVMNERLDRFQINGTWVDIPVAGVFVLRDGLIAEWRDYFDLQSTMTAMAAAGEEASAT